MDAFLRDVKYAVRGLLRSPGFSSIAVVTLALGMGVNTAMFNIVNGILLRELPYADADRLVRVYQANPEQRLQNASISVPDFDDWREQTQSFVGMAAYFRTGHVLTGRGDPLEIESAFVTDDFFGVLGAPVQLGRPLLAEDIQQASRTVVISHGLWTTRFAANPQVIGTPLLLAGQPFTIVGVMRPDFRYPTQDTDVWAPESVLTETQIGPRVRNSRFLESVARLGDGVTLEQARADLNRVVARLAVEYADTNAGWSAATVVPLQTAIVGNVDRALTVLLAAVGFILLIGCANLANLLLARGASRSREVAIRIALGSGRMRIIRQLLTESLVLALMGGVIGLVLSIWGVKAVLALSADTLPRVEDVYVDGRVTGFGFILALVTGVLLGLVPALNMSRVHPQKDLKDGRAIVGPSQRIQRTLVVAQVALTIALVIGAGLVARSFLELRTVDAGFNAEQGLAVSIQWNLTGADRPIDRIRQRRQELIDRVATLPGVVESGLTNSLPLQTDRWEVFEFRRSDGSGAQDGGMLRADRSYVSPGYLRTMGIPLRRGEPLPNQWASGAPFPILVSETAAQRFWPDRDAVGQVVRGVWGEAVVSGVVGDVRHLGLAQPPSPVVYVPQVIGPRILTTLVVRTSGDPLRLVEPLRQTIRELDPNQPIRSIATLSGVMSESIARDRFFTILFGLFGGLALLLATVGVYGVIAYSVSQRTREIGVRMALGARVVDVLFMVVSGGMWLVFVGIAIGAVASLLLTSVLQSLLYGISATDALVFAAAPAVLASVALLARYVPARRAAGIEPTVALRQE